MELRPISKTAISKWFYNKQLGQNAKYRYSHNTLFLGFQTVQTGDKEALVIHESTHAACDIAKKTLSLLHSEAAAYIAQCLYFYYANQAALAKGSTPTFNNTLLKAAWDIAMKARNNSNLTEDDIKPLTAEIAKNPNYKDRVNQNEAFDGV